jgi:N-acyl-D-amino-acid deacylase
MADRGTIRPGAWADLAIFDLAAVEDRATYLDPHQLAAGMAYVLVNGTVVIDDGQFTPAHPGRVLRK